MKSFLFRSILVVSFASLCAHAYAIPLMIGQEASAGANTAAGSHTAAVASSGTMLRVGLKNQVHEIKVSDLAQKFSATEIQIEKHPGYPGEQKHYKAVSLKNVLKSFLTNADDKLENYKIIVTCSDGYRPVLDVSLFDKAEGFIAVEESGVQKSEKLSSDKKWSLVKSEDGKYVDPAPFYIVWKGDIAAENWPYMVVGIELVHKKDFNEFAKLAPLGAFDAKIEAGYELFTQKCTVCHSIRNVGPHGRAPDLGYVTRYRDDQYILNTIKNGRGKMPAWKSTVSESQRLLLLSYLKNMATAD